MLRVPLLAVQGGVLLVEFDAINLQGRVVLRNLHVRGVFLFHGVDRVLVVLDVNVLTDLGDFSLIASVGVLDSEVGRLTVHLVVEGGVVNDLLHLELVLGSLLVNLVVDVSSVKLSLLFLPLSEAGLQVLEQGLRKNCDVGNLDGLEPDTPTLDEVLHVCDNTITDLLTVSNEVLKSVICNNRTHDGRSLGGQVVISGLGNPVAQVLSQVHVSFVWTSFMLVNGPDQSTRNFNTLHVSVDLLGGKFNLVNL